MGGDHDAIGQGEATEGEGSKEWIHGTTWGGHYPRRLNFRQTPGSPSNQSGMGRGLKRP